MSCEVAVVLSTSANFSLISNFWHFLNLAGKEKRLIGLRQAAPQAKNQSSTCKVDEKLFSEYYFFNFRLSLDTFRDWF